MRINLPPDRCFVMRLTIVRRSPGCNPGDLETSPSRLRLFSSWRSSPASVFRRLPPGFKHCFRITIISVARYCRRFNRIAAILYLQHHSRCNFLFILSYRTSHSQPGIDIYCGTSPECASIDLFTMVAFSPLCPT